jgi:hypothetical protein
MKSSEAKNMVVTFIFGAVGTIAAIWFLFESYREASELRAYLRFSRM